MTKHIELRTVHQGTALTTGSLTLPALVIEGLEEFKASLPPGQQQSRRCLRPTPNSSVASATSGILIGRAIAGARS